jgi:hypothetical protein
MNVGGGSKGKSSSARVSDTQENNCPLTAILTFAVVTLRKNILFALNEFRRQEKTIG